MSGATPQFVFDRRSIREVDRVAIEEYGMPGVMLMENAARGASDVALDMLRAGNPARRAGLARAGESALIICGLGNNGGDGYAMARHLHNAGVNVILLPLGEPRPGSDAATNRDICRRMNLREIAPADRYSLNGVDLIIDAIFGTGLDRAVTGEAAEMICWINAQSVPVLAVDLPSGMDADTGEPLGDCVRAAMTVTFAGIKRGFTVSEAALLLGEVHVVDIGVPRELLERLGRAERV